MNFYNNFGIAIKSIIINNAPTRAIHLFHMESPVIFLKNAIINININSTPNNVTAGFSINKLEFNHL